MDDPTRPVPPALRHLRIVDPDAGMPPFPLWVLPNDNPDCTGDISCGNCGGPLPEGTAAIEVGYRSYDAGPSDFRVVFCLPCLADAVVAAGGDL